MKIFHMDAANLAWLEGIEDSDQCLHGHGIALIGERRLEYDCTVSATGLQLLKSLTEDHDPNNDSQMLPCCGHFLIPDEAGENVYISGCPNGIDWTVRHIPGGVELILEDGYAVTVPMADYRREVLAFVQKIEDFYNAAPPRPVPEDDFNRRGWQTFWREWHRRKEEPCPTS